MIMQCKYFGKCGGCSYIDMSYDEQLKIKQDHVSGCLKMAAANGACKEIKIEKIIGADEPYHYRNKVHSVFSRDRKGNIIRGMYREESHDVVNVSGCLLEDETADAIIEEIRHLAVRFKMKIYDEDRGTGFFRHVLIRVASKEYMVILVTGEVPFTGKNNFIRVLRGKFPQITTIVQNINNKRTSMILGERNIVIYGKGYVVDDSLGFDFRISPSSFFQINTAQTRKLYDLVLQMADPGPSDVVLDAYCGTGTIGMFLSRKAGRVIGVELNPDAVKDAKENAVKNKVSNIEFICADATKYMQLLSAEKAGISILCMDPPRSGSTPEFITAAAKLEIPRIIYVSCNPETLARDLQLFAKNGYKAESAVPVDMFPFTGHVETVVCLSQQKPDDHIEIEIDLDEIDATSAETKATYKEIQNWVQEHHGFHVTNLNIAQVKQKHGIIERENYNKAKSADSKQPGCPEEKVKAIEDAMRHFQMI